MNFSLLGIKTTVYCRFQIYFCPLSIPQGEVVAQVRAFDGDRGVDDDILYEIISGNLEINGTPSFIIGRETGVISVNNISSLDRETHSQYTLTVQVSG